MNKTSGFRTIQFTEVQCKYYYYGVMESEYCTNGIITHSRYDRNNVPLFTHTGNICKSCNGTGLVEKVESKIE